MSSPDPSSKKDNQRNTKKDTKPHDKPASSQPLSLLKDLPSLNGKPKQQSYGFDDNDFDDD